MYLYVTSAIHYTFYNICVRIYSIEQQNKVLVNFIRKQEGGVDILEGQRKYIEVKRIFKKWFQMNKIKYDLWTEKQIYKKIISRLTFKWNGKNARWLSIKEKCRSLLLCNSIL